jgi:hypothetical protein
MSQNYFKSGEWNAICDSCGRKFKASQLKRRWDGFMVCEEDYEARHIADFIRAPKGERPIPWSRPEGTDVSVGPTYISESSGTQDTTIPTVTPGNEGAL